MSEAQRPSVCRVAREAGAGRGRFVRLRALRRCAWGFFVFRFRSLSFSACLWRTRCLQTLQKRHRVQPPRLAHARMASLLFHGCGFRGAGWGVLRGAVPAPRGAGQCSSCTARQAASGPAATSSAPATGRALLRRGRVPPRCQCPSELLKGRGVYAESRSTRPLSAGCPPRSRRPAKSRESPRRETCARCTHRTATRETPRRTGACRGHGHNREPGAGSLRVLSPQPRMHGRGRHRPMRQRAEQEGDPFPLTVPHA